MQSVLTIAGFDPSSGAGVTADLMVFAAQGLFGTACITALTVQSTLGVQRVQPLSDILVGETLECLREDVRPAGIKIGMVADAAIVRQICRFLRQVNVEDGEMAVPVVLDPVVRSSSGRELLDGAGVEVLRNQLLPLAGWVTPNLEELELLAGVEVTSSEQIPGACHELQRKVAGRDDGRRIGIFAKGGHLDRPDDFLLTPEGAGTWLPGVRVETRSTHGTGCALSSAFLSRLVLGDQPEAAARAAKEYVSGALRNAESYGRGRGPMNHLWQILEAKD